jgi:hypothetical protein
MEQGNNQTGITPHLQEGLKAYTAEMADMEERRHFSWAMSWASIREWAKMVLKRQLQE